MVNVKLLALIAIGAGSIIYMSSNEPLGIRNNNPLNMREVGIPWNGKNGENGGFTTFETPYYGIRAAANDIKNKWLDGKRTIRDLITVWAPDSENDTATYIASVSWKTNIRADQHIMSVDELTNVIQAMIYHENGQQPYPPDLIGSAVLDGITSGAGLPFFFDVSPGGMYA